MYSLQHAQFHSRRPAAWRRTCSSPWRTGSTSSHCPSSCARSSHRRRARLGELCRIAARLLTDAYTAAAPGARPGLILFVQTFGDLVNFNPHLHVLAADGVFGADGTFSALPPVPEALTCRRFSARSVIARSFTRNASTARRARRLHDPGSHVAGEDDL